MIYTISRSVRCLLGAGLFVIPGILGIPALCEDAAVSVSFELPVSTVTLHEPVYLKFSIHNELGEKIHFDLGFDRKENFSFVILEPTGSTTQIPRYNRGGLGEGGELALEPGETYAQSIVFNEFYQFARPGRYTLAARLTANIRTESGKVFAPGPAQKVELQILPRNPERLASVCQSLAERSVNTRDYVVARDAAFALSFVNDSIAVPYLGHVLEGSAASIAIPGLVRIGSPEAERILASHLNTSNWVLKTQIDQAIQEIKTGVHPKIMD